jgi:hypothetical protein
VFRVTIGGLESPSANRQPKSKGEIKMNSVQRFAISVVAVTAFACVAGCGSTTKEVEKTTTYVPAAPAQVVVQPAPVQVVPPTTTTNTSSERSSNSSDSGNAGTVDSSSSHHSESTTVTPSN